MTIVCVAAATAVRYGLDPLVHDQVAYTLNVVAVVLSTWFCGQAGGALAIFVSAPLCNYLFVEPRYELVPHQADLWAMSIFVAVSLGLVWLVGRWRRAEQALRAQATELAQADRVKDEFLATVSHELRTPLNAILGWAEILRTVALDGGAAKRALEVIGRSARRQAELIDELLDISRIVAGTLRLERAPVDAASVVRSAVEAVIPSAQANGVEVVLSGSAGPFTVIADEARLQQVVGNVLSNAVKFTPDGGRITVTVASIGESVEIAVKDTGIGIGEDFLPHVFERFRQAEGVEPRTHGGLGLGLAIVRHLVEAHGGRVRAESGGQGKGATFIVTLPAGAGEECGGPQSLALPAAPLGQAK